MSSLLKDCVGFSAVMAIRFEKAFGLKAETLCRTQTAHDLATAQRFEKKFKVKAFGSAA